MGEGEVRFPDARGTGDVHGAIHVPQGGPRAALVVAHGRGADMRYPAIFRLAAAAAEAGVWALRFNFRYVDAKGSASRDLSAEADDLLGAVRFARSVHPNMPIFAAGFSMGARVAARASADPDIVGVIALGYPLHPRFRPEVRNPPEWPKLVKPTLFVQGDRDPFCDLNRLREELPRLSAPRELVVIPGAGHTFTRAELQQVWDAVHAWIDRQLGP